MGEDGGLYEYSGCMMYHVSMCMCTCTKSYLLLYVM